MHIVVLCERPDFVLIFERCTTKSWKMPGSGLNIFCASRIYRNQLFWRSFARNYVKLFYKIVKRDRNHEHFLCESPNSSQYSNIVSKRFTRSTINYIMIDCRVNRPDRVQMINKSYIVVQPLQMNYRSNFAEIKILWTVTVSIRADVLSKYLICDFTLE